MKLSKLTIGFGAFIIISAAFITKAWDLIENLFGENNVDKFRIAVFSLFAVLILLYIFKSCAGFFRVSLSLAILTGALVFSWRQPYFVEKLHIFEYGLLGWLATKDLNKDKISINHILLAILFVSLIGVLDEGFQKLLPYRVCDIRDMVTNGISGSFGVILYLLK